MSDPLRNWPRVKDVVGWLDTWDHSRKRSRVSHLIVQHPHDGPKPACGAQMLAMDAPGVYEAGGMACGRCAKTKAAALDVQVSTTQMAGFEPWCGQWISRALEERRGDRAIAERGIRAHYQIARMAEPVIVWTTSPLTVAVAGCLATGSKTPLTIQVSEANGAEIQRATSAANDAIRDAMGETEYASRAEYRRDRYNTDEDGYPRCAPDAEVEPKLSDNIIGAVDAAVRRAELALVRAESATWISAESATWTASMAARFDQDVFGMREHVGHVAGVVRHRVVSEPIHRSVRSTSFVSEKVRTKVCRGWDNCLGGHLGIQRASAAIVGTFYRDVCGVNLAPEAVQAAEDVTECGWWWPGDGFVTVCDRPTRLRLDTEGLLHSDDGPAIQWEDGSGLWCWHGKPIDRVWIEDPKHNVAMRGCTCERRPSRWPSRRAES